MQPGADILIALRSNDIDIENAAIEQPSLDEVFMALTGNAATPVSPLRPHGNEQSMTVITNPARVSRRRQTAQSARRCRSATSSSRPRRCLASAPQDAA